MTDNAEFRDHTHGGQQPSHHNLYPQSAAGGPADSDRSDIRVLEPRISTQQNGNQLCSAHAQEEAESVRLIQLAKENGLYLSPTEINNLGVLHGVRSGESRIYYNESQNLVYKVRDPFAKRVIKNIAPQDIIYEHLIHNRLFPNTRYNFIGITEELGSVRFVFSQQYFDNRMPVPDKQIVDYLLGRGLTKEDNYFYGNDYYSITDVSQESDNVFVTPQGELLFIDPIIRLKKPALEVLEYLQKNPQPDASIDVSQPRSVWQQIKSLFKISHSNIWRFQKIA